jgi:hypothetical protein
MTELDALHAARLLQPLQLSPTEVLLIDHATGERHVLAPEVVEALAACASFAPLEVQRQRVLTALPGLSERAAAIMPVLQGLVSRGLLQSAAAAVQRLGAGSAVQGGLAPAWLLLPPTGAPGPSAAAVAQLARLARACGGLRLICDNSAQAQSWLAPLQPLAVQVECIDAQIQRDWLTTLARDERDQSALLALAGPSVDASWRTRAVNFVLLNSVGRRVLLLDPDQLGPLSALPDVRRGLDPSPAASRQAWFDLPLAAELPDDAWTSAIDWCGRPVGQLLSGAGPFALTAAEIEGQTVADLQRLGEGGQVKAILFGSRGALDCPHNRWLYTLDADSRERLCQFDYGRRRLGDSVLHGMNRARLLRGTAFAPSLLAVDQGSGFESPLGDTPHLLRGALGQLLDPTARSLHLPWFLGRSDSAVVDRVAAGRAGYRPGINRLLAEWAQVEQGRCLAAGPADRAQWWAAQLQDLAAATPQARRERLCAYTSQAQAQLINALQYQLESAQNVPPAWRDDVVAIVEAQARAVLSEAEPSLAGYEPGEDASARFASELSMMADWTRRWPDWLNRAGQAAATV